MAFMELTMAEAIEGRDRADEAGNESLFQYYCRRIDELEHEEDHG